jgi:hypothetical protein
MTHPSSLAAHLGDTARDLAQRFSQFSLILDWGTLTRHWSGFLTIDLVTGQTRHSGTTVEPLTITGDLLGWLRESLVVAGLSKTATEEAVLTATLSFERYSGQRESGVLWTGNPNRFVTCHADVHCRLRVGTVVGEASVTEVMEWPEPSAT